MGYGGTCLQCLWKSEIDLINLLVPLINLITYVLFAIEIRLQGLKDV